MLCKLITHLLVGKRETAAAVQGGGGGGVG